MLTLYLLSLLTLSNGALAWGTLGHDTVALVAQHYVTTETKTFCQEILGNKSETYLADVATWADQVRRTKGYTYTAPFHFIDAEDNPPASCGVDYQRDCGEAGCVVSAIQNYTSRLLDESLPATERTNALKFVVHFLGDIHQPLHDEAIDVGGNTVNVTFDGDKTNLHAIWDTNMPEKLVGGYSMAYAQTWSTNLTSALEKGIYKDQKADWLSGMNLNDSVSSAMVWARDANAFVCSVVMPGGVDVLETGDLADSYYDTTVDTIELQIAKAGYRLAGWLNLIATGSINLDVAQSTNDTVRAPISYLPRGVKNEFSAAKLARREFGPNCNHKH